MVVKLEYIYAAEIVIGKDSWKFERKENGFLGKDPGLRKIETNEFIF